VTENPTDRNARPPTLPPRVLATRADKQAGELVSELLGAGLDAIAVPTIAVELEPGGGALDAGARALGSYAWVVITSANGARALLAAAERVLTPFEGSRFAAIASATRFAAIGSATRRALEVGGLEVDFQPSQSNADALAAELDVSPADRVLIVRGDLADQGLAARLRARGAEVDDVIGYRTREAPQASRGLLRQAMSDGPIAAVVFTSGSTVRGLVALGRDESIDVLSLPCVCIGPETANEAGRAGFRVMAISPAPDSAALAAATAKALAPVPREIS
jgi:uroporphyrinogen-III synthase